MKLHKILHGSDFGLAYFDAATLGAMERAITERGGKFYAVCAVRGKEIQLKPEEVVRQLFLLELMKKYGYPKDRVEVEYPVRFGREVKRADIAIMDKERPDTPYIIAEIKKPKERDGKSQLKSYCNASGAPMAVWCNGQTKICYHRKDPNYFEEIRDIPNAAQTLKKLLQTAWTLDDLIAGNLLVKKGRSLKDIIESLEDEVLANSGAAIFEEAFKLIYAKLYDEWLSGGHPEKRKNRNLEFHNAGETGGELRDKIQNLFNRAKEKWPGVFADGAKIMLTPSHLAVCVGSLERVKLLNSNLDVVDDAFEYLINKESRGDKGQYFTPRYVIDMCVKMLNPDEKEFMIDTAAGSSGFPIHAIFHVWQKILKRKGISQSHLFTVERKPAECEEYVSDKVFAVDFDDKAVRVSRALNLIAGDGQTNVLHLNTLDYKRWEETTKNEDWHDIYYEGEKKLRRLRAEKNSARDYKFDIVMANPPFAGDIRESDIIHCYDLGRKMKWRKNIDKPTHTKKWHEKISRHILFIERNLQFLKPGGRMAIVLPQGIFNNITDFPQRYFIQEHCRILAVVGLHGNTFKPHTGTKTSVLFVQKWNDDPKAGALCPRTEDYNIFFATMQKPGKDNSGEKIFIKRPKTAGEENAAETEHGFLLDAYEHKIPEHDLFNLYEHHFPDDENEKARALLDAPGIAEAFLEFAKKEGLSFAKTALKVNWLNAISKQKYSRVKEINRWDSEYYLPKYDEMIREIRRFPTKRLHEIADIKKSIEPGSDAYQESGIPFIRVADFSKFGITTTVKYLDEKEYGKTADSLSPRKNTILLSKDGTLGIAYKMEETMRAITSGALLHLKIKDASIDPDYLTLVLNSLPVQMQVERDSGGSIIKHWRPDQVAAVLIPILPPAQQKALVAQAQKSFALRRQANTVLETAKSAVEIAIVKGEKAALRKLDKN